MFHGSMVAIVTPFTEKNAVDFAALTQLIEWHIEAGTAAIVVVGTTGEAATLSQAEKIQTIRHAVTVAKERIPIIAGTATAATASTAALSLAAMEAGVDACLIMTPAYIKPTQAGLYAHYKQIADTAALPIILYNVPSRTACDLLPETIQQLAHCPNIIGIKEAGGSLERVRQIHQLCGDSIDIYSGEDAIGLDCILAGGKGVISVTANVAPREMSTLCAAALQGEVKAAEEIQKQLQPLHHALFVESNPIPVKWALQQMGLICGAIRLPLTPLAKPYQQQVREALQVAGIHTMSNNNK